MNPNFTRFAVHGILAVALIVLGIGVGFIHMTWDDAPMWQRVAMLLVVAFPVWLAKMAGEMSADPWDEWDEEEDDESEESYTDLKPTLVRQAVERHAYPTVNAIFAR